MKDFFFKFKGELIYIKKVRDTKRSFFLLNKIA